MPALGPEQWAVVTSLAPTFQGSVADLVLVAQATVPGDRPLDVTEWQRWARRARWKEEVRQAGTAAVASEQYADFEEAEAEAARRRAEEAQRRAAAARATATRLRDGASSHRSALGLGDRQLAVYEAAVDAGTPPAEALARVAGPQG